MQWFRFSGSVAHYLTRRYVYKVLGAIEQMETDNWFDLILYSLFTLSVIVIGLPLGARLLFYSLKRLIIIGNNSHSENLLIKKFGKTPLETFFVGSFLVVVSIWYLLFDRGGALLTLGFKITQFLAS